MSPEGLWGWPHLLRPGQPYTLEAYSRYGLPSLFDVALPYLSTTRVSIPVPPFGTLGIDPMVALLPIWIPQPANSPAFAGIEIFAQAAILHLPFEIRLTNVTADSMVR